MMMQGLAGDADCLSSSHGFLTSLLLSYSALVPVKNLRFPSDISFDAVHRFLLRKILLNPHLKKYPPSESYQQSFWKWALVQLEGLSRNDEDDDIDERVYAHYLSLRPGPCLGTPADSFVTHYWKPVDPHGRTMEVDRCETITLLESRTTIEAGTTGLRTWRASLALAQYLIQHPYLVETSGLLELGSGTGFIGILVASLQLHATPSLQAVPSIYLTDVNSAVLERCQSNIGLHCRYLIDNSSSHPNMYFKSLDWFDSLSDQESLRFFFDKIGVDILVGADIVFDPQLIPPLVKTISLAFSCERTRLGLIALAVRNEETLSYFLEEIEKELRVEEVVQNTTGNLLLQLPDQVDAALEVKIFQITRAKNAQLS